MNILFGEVTGEYLESCLVSGSNLFEVENKYFDFSIDTCSSHFSVRDTLGRCVPIGVEEFEEFYQAVKLARGYAKAMAKAQYVSDLVDSDETLYACD